MKNPCYKRVLASKVLAIFIILIHSFPNLYGQGWTRVFHPLNMNYSTTAFGGIENTPDGGFILAGSATQGVDWDMLVIKTDPEGYIQWEKRLINIDTFLDAGLDIELVSSGGYIVAGQQRDTSENYSGYAVRIDLSGNTLWEYTTPPVNPPRDTVTFQFNAVFETPDGGFLLQSNNGTIYKLNATGTLVWSQQYHLKTSDFSKNPNDTYSMVAFEFSPDSLETDGRITTIDQDGNTLWSIPIGTPLYYEYNGVVTPTLDNGLISAHHIQYNSSQVDSLFIEFHKMDSLGVIEWTNRIESHYATTLYDIKATPDGGYILSGSSLDVAISATAIKVDANGNLLWKKSLQKPRNFIEAAITSDGDYVFAGNYGFSTIYNYSNTAYLIKLTSSGEHVTNYIKGTVGKDDNLNCLADSSETRYKNWLVQAKDQQQTSHFEVTDSLGNYEFNLDSGLYDLKLLPPGPLWGTCQTQTQISLAQYDTAVVDLVVHPVVTCPYLTVGISTSFLRRCFQNTFQVAYCNYGTADATNVYVDVDFDQYLHVDTSSIPWFAQNGTTYSFFLGDLAVNECRSFKVLATVDCDSTLLGQTHCVEAHIYPDSLCLSPGMDWDGSITTVTATCELDSVLLNIENTGTSNMTNPLEYIVAEDNLIVKSGMFLLAVSENLPLKFPANGSTYRIFAEQAGGYYPINYLPTAAIEGCGLNPITQTFTVGLLNNLPNSDQIDQISKLCLENGGSYDPNDKRGYPEGVGEDHIIEAGVDLDYHIRFQNTGTDTAFTVVIRDTISQHLDLTTIVLGASSHNYDFSIVNGTTLKFTFNNILLVDSVANEPDSHGFLSFKIAQQDSLPLGTLITNSAAIYFDYNAPVITKETYHEIGKILVTIVPTEIEVPAFPDLQITAFPNPFQNSTVFNIEGAPKGEKQFVLTDGTGRIVHQHFFENHQYELTRKRLAAGIYFYSILYEGSILGSGKVMVSY